MERGYDGTGFRMLLGCLIIIIIVIFYSISFCSQYTISANMWNNLQAKSFFWADVDGTTFAYRCRMRLL